MSDSHVADRLGDHLEGDLTSAEFAGVDTHLADCAECSAELSSLRQTVALVRGLPDPLPPSDLAANVMQRIEADAASRRPVIELFRRMPAPIVYTALAAGFAALVAIPMLDTDNGVLLGSPVGDAPERSAKASSSVGAPGAGTESQRRLASLSPDPAPVRSLALYQVPLRVSAEPTQPGREIGFYGNAAPEIPLRDLDGELDAALANPAEFLERVRRTSADARRPLVAPLVEHSARRGDGASFARTLGHGVTPLAVPASTGR